MAEVYHLLDCIDELRGSLSRLKSKALSDPQVWVREGGDLATCALELAQGLANKLPPDGFPTREEIDRMFELEL